MSELATSYLEQRIRRTQIYLAVVAVIAIGASTMSVFLLQRRETPDRIVMKNGDLELKLDAGALRLSSHDTSMTITPASIMMGTKPGAKQHGSMHLAARGGISYREGNTIVSLLAGEGRAALRASAKGMSFSLEASADTASNLYLTGGGGTALLTTKGEGGIVLSAIQSGQAPVRLPPR